MNNILPYCYFFNHLKLARARKDYFFIIRASVKTKSVLRIFYKLNLIRRFTFMGNSRCCVFPTYTRSGQPIRSLKNYYRAVNPIFIKKHSLLLMRRSLGATTILLETSHGLITHNDALSLGIGGIMVCIIW